MNGKREIITKSLTQIFSGISSLVEAFDGKRQFTIDGRLVGDLGEVIAELEYELEIDRTSQPYHDATTFDGKRVQIKATFKESLTFKTIPDYYLGLKLYQDGSYKEIFNGPGEIIGERYNHRKNIGKNLLSFPINELKKLNITIHDSQKIRKRIK
jgi:hypothetical protein